MTHTTNPIVILGIALVIGAGGMIVHLIRRYHLMRTSFTPEEEISFDRTQRVLHWSIGVGILGLVVTGLPIYLSQFLVSPPVPTPLRFFYWGVQVYYWRIIHIYLALLVVGLVILHVGWDVYGLKTTRKIRVTKSDIGQAVLRARNFLGLTSSYQPPKAKYDFFQKAFHWSLIVLGAFLLVTGLLEWEAIKLDDVPFFILIDRVSPWFMDSFVRTGHIVAAMLVFGLVGLHAYFALLPQNRKILNAIVMGAKIRTEGQAETEE